MFGKSISVSGDSALATRFSKILIDAALDWEAILAQLLGDLPAHESPVICAGKLSYT